MPDNTPRRDRVQLELTRANLARYLRWFDYASEVVPSTAECAEIAETAAYLTWRATRKWGSGWEVNV